MNAADRLAQLLNQAWEHPLSDAEQWLADNGKAVVNLITAARDETAAHSWALPDLEAALEPLLRDEGET